MKKRPKLVRAARWRPPVLALVLFLGFALFLAYRLGSLMPTLSMAEIATRSLSNSLHKILANPINAPYTLLVYGLIRLHHHGALALRSVAALYGLLTLGSFYYILRRWQSPRVAALSTLLLGTSCWFLHISRSGTPLVLQFGLIPLLAASIWLRRTPHRNTALFVMIAALAAALYIPGLIWFIVAALIWRGRTYVLESSYIAPWRLWLAIILLVVLLAPLLIASYHQPHLLLFSLGLPEHFPAWRSIGHNLLNVPLAIFWRSPKFDSSLWLNRLPILDVFEIAMFALGAYAFGRHWRLERTRLLLGGLLLGTLLIGFGGPVSFSLLVPFVYLVISGGITYLLHEWFSVFPLNPIARNFGTSLILIAVLVSCGYQLESYFIAWAHSPATKAAYTRFT